MKIYTHKIYLAIAAMIIGLGVAFAVAPPANSVIGNQATASFTDSTGAVRTATSNLVQTTVAQVNSVSLTQDQTKSVAPGGTVYFPHTITNTGNGPDTYSLSALDATAGNGVTSTMCTGGTPVAPTPAGCNVFIYPDIDGNGIPDSGAFLTGTALTTVVTAGDPYKFVVAMQWPAGVTVNPAAPEKITVTATSQGGTNGSTAASPVSNTDTINVTSAAVINVNKSLSKTTGARSTAACPVAAPGSVAAPVAGCENLLVTLTYTNTGAANAVLTLTDLIGAGATSGMKYIPSSAKWSGCSPAAPITDAGAAATAEAAPCGNIGYDFGVTTASTVTAIIRNIAPGQSGTLSFEVNVLNTAPTGTAGTNNTANYSFTGGLASDATPKPTNPASYTVTPAAGVAQSNSSVAGTGNVVDPTVFTGTGIDLAQVASAPQGSTVWFRNVVWNTGTDTDSFDMTTLSTTFPAGTAVSFYSDSGANTGTSGTAIPASLGSPLTDSNGNGIVDTGPVVAGPTGFKVVWVKVDLPPNATVNAPGFNLVNKATSKNNPALSDLVKNELVDIVERTVDLTNGAAVGPATVVGNGVTVQTGLTTPPATVINNTAVVPGSKTRFNLALLPSAADNYDFTAWNDYGALGVSANPFGTAGTAGYSVTYYPGACPAAGVAISAAAITNTGVISNTTTATPFCAEVTVPASATPGTLDIYFRALSPATGKMTAPYASWDVIHDAMTIASTAVVTITPDRTGTTFPGGSVVYSHQVCNVGNSSAAVVLSASNSNAVAGFTTALWVDVDNSGTITAGDTALASGATITVPANTCLNVLDNTFAPAGASNGVTNTTTITASVGGTPIGSVNDTTSVVVSSVSLFKEQREITCVGGGAGAPVAGVNGAWTSGTMTGKINPGACLQYRVTATNSGSAGVTGLVVSDATPNYTTYNAAACTATANTGSVITPTVTTPAAGTAGNVSSSAAAVPALGTVQLVFCVKVDI